MTILPHLDHQHTRAAALFDGEILHRLLDGRKASVTLVGGTIDASQHLDLSAVASKDLLHRGTDFAHGGALADGDDGRL